MKAIVSPCFAEKETSFKTASSPSGYTKVTLSNRPDLCEYQCNGAMAGAKAYKFKTKKFMTIVQKTPHKIKKKMKQSPVLIDISALL